MLSCYLVIGFSIICLQEILKGIRQSTLFLFKTGLRTPKVQRRKCFSLGYKFYKTSSDPH
jgi:hypothetical protein